MAVVKAGRYLLALGLLALFLLVFLSIMSELMDKNNYGIRRSWQKMRTVDKHFFFDLLPSFDLPVSDNEMYQPSQNLVHSQFADIIDRVLLSRYLVDRFAYTSFIQFGCNREQSIYQLLPDTSMKSRVCVDKIDGTIRSSATAYLNSSYAQNRQFDLVVANADNLSTDLLNSYLNMLSDGGSMLLPGSNNFKGGPNNTKEIHEEDLINLRCIIAMRGRQDLDLATLDADRGLSVVYKRRNSAYMDSFATDAALGSLDQISLNANGNGNGIEAGTMLVNQELIERLLNLMRFETLHDWLAPTGKVDAVTAFGGDKAFSIFREAEQYEMKCLKIAADATQQDSALRCLQEASSAGRLSLRSRWHLALLLIQSNRMVEAVTALGELMSLNPMWYKWMLGQLSSQIAQSLVSSRSTRLGASDVDAVFKGGQNGRESYEQPQVVSKSRNAATAEDSTSRYDGAVEDREFSASNSLRSGRGRQGTEDAMMESQTRVQRSRRSGKRRKGKIDLPKESIESI